MTLMFMLLMDAYIVVVKMYIIQLEMKSEGNRSTSTKINLKFSRIRLVVLLEKFKLMLALSS